MTSLLPGDAWEGVAPMSWRRSHAGAAYASGRLCVCGGKGQALLRLSSVEALDRASGTWSPLPSMQEHRSQAAVTALSDTVFVCGGFDGVQHLRSSESLGARDTKWNRLPDMPVGRSGAAAAATAGRVYVCGGFDGRGSLANVDSLGLRSALWRSQCPMQQSRQHFVAAVLWSNEEATQEHEPAHSR